MKYLINSLSRFLFSFALSGIAFLSLSSCDKKDDDLKQAEYTVMLYGCGGGNLDRSLYLNLQEAFNIGSSAKVGMTVQVKYSNPYQEDEDLKGTRRFVVGKGGPKDEVVMDVSLPLYKPESLAEFIKWSKAKCPARKYILILWNHGNGWHPYGDGTLYDSRAVIFDDNLDYKAMSVNQLVEGIEKSNTKFEIIYYDACSMNMLENLAEIAPVAKYALGSAHVTPDLGGEYGILLSLLNEKSNMLDAIGQYCKVVMNHWNPLGWSLDITMTDLSKLPKVFNIMKSISDELLNTYENENFVYAYNISDQYTYLLVEGYPFYDIGNYLGVLSRHSYNPALFTLSSRFFLAAKEAIVVQEISRACPTNITWGVTLVDKVEWNDIYVPFSKYEDLLFDKSTGWSNWLKTNEIVAVIDDGEDGGNEEEAEE